MKRHQLRVVAGVIERAGLILVGQRRAGDRFQFKWEFPGGKVEPDEDPKVALARELREELGIQAEIGEELARYEHQYPGRTTILLIFFRVCDFTGEPANHVFENIQWEARHRLTEYDFLDGDVDFVRRLARGSL
ncbi:MAG: (deoxy)nucleoside triphosphate pyrophosphohydrolase [Bryobacteraceae bacterium]